MAQKCFKKVLSSVIGLVWFGNNSKNEFSIPKNIEKDPLHTHMAQKMNKKWMEGGSRKAAAGRWHPEGSC